MIGSLLLMPPFDEIFLAPKTKSRQMVYVYFQDDESSASKEICLPYKTENRPGIGRVLIATRTIKPMELVLIDPGTVTGPNYTSKPVCLECLRPVNG